MKADAWMPFYPADYLRKTMRLTRDQHGGYFLLLLACWDAGGRLPNDPDELAAIVKASPAEWRKLAPKLLPFFEVDGGWLVHSRVLAEHEKARELSEKRRQAAKAGNNSRWGESDGKTRSERLADARALASHTEGEWSALVWATGRQCVRCRALEADLIGGALCKDHIVAVSKGGHDGIENLQPVCRECNTAKGSGHIDFRENASPGWRERLAKRLANATQTPPPTRVAPPSPSPPPNGGIQDADASLSDRPDPTSEPELFEPKPPDEVREAFDLWNELARRAGLPRARDLDPSRRKAIRARLAEGGLEAWQEALSAVERSRHCRGENDRHWRADLDFVCQLKSWRRLLEGAYGADFPVASQTVEPPKPWPGPPDIRAAVVTAKDEGFARNYLDPSGWRNGPDRVITCRTNFAAETLSRDVGDVLRRHDVTAVFEGKSA